MFFSDSQSLHVCQLQAQKFFFWRQFQNCFSSRILVLTPQFASKLNKAYHKNSFSLVFFSETATILVETWFCSQPCREWQLCQRQVLNLRCWQIQRICLKKQFLLVRIIMSGFYVHLVVTDIFTANSWKQLSVSLKVGTLFWFISLKGYSLNQLNYFSSRINILIFLYQNDLNIFFYW